ncbi:hypothetical protein [Microbacterium sp.]|uniref:hypothetical protein n=1 Tax=Microbacterium sp. TaxID=51671 RepID=UPI003A95C3D4
MANRLTDDELDALAAERGVRAVYEAGYDLGIDRMREHNARSEDFIESMHAVIREMGFGPLGLSREMEIISALQSIAADRARR